MTCRTRTRRQSGAPRSHAPRTNQAKRPLLPPVWLDPLEGRLLFSTYTVTTLGDSAGSVTPTGTGTFNATTLRAALNAANGHAGADTVKFASGLTGTINLGSALPRINDALTLNGPGATKLTVRRSSTATTAFPVLSVNAAVTAAVSGLTISRGTGTRQSDGSDRGGGVLNAGTLTLTNCTLSGNTAAGANGTNATATKVATGGKDGLGGAVYTSGTLTLTGCTLSNNVAAGGGGGNSSSDFSGENFGGNGGGGQGGGVYVAAGKLTVTSSTLSGNTAAGSGGGGYNGYGGQGGGTGGAGTGGGVAAASGTTLTLTGSTLSGNIARGGLGGSQPGGGGGGRPFGDNGGGFGGGLNSAGTASLTSCTLSGNMALGGTEDPHIPYAGAAQGGGLWNRGALTLTRSTVTANQAVGAPAGGGGLFNSSAGRLTVDASTVSNNKADVGTSGDNAQAAGGGIDSAGTATVTNSTLAGNRADAGGGGVGFFEGGAAFGGGVANGFGATLTLTASTLSGNFAAAGSGGESYTGPSGGYAGPGGNAYGGGVSNAGTTTITNCTLSGNAAQGGTGGSQGNSGPAAGGDGFGGGAASDGTLTIVGSTFDNNFAQGGAGASNPAADQGGDGGRGFGGGLSTGGPGGGNTTVVNSTFNANSADAGPGGDAQTEFEPGTGTATTGGAGGESFGGGVWVQAGSLALTNSTIFGNTAAPRVGGQGYATGGSGGQGPTGTSSAGGVGVNAGATARPANTIIAGNGAANRPDVRGAFASAGHNLIGDVDSATGFTSADLLGGNGHPVIDPRLAPLSDNGGPTLTMALKPGSPAIDAGSDALAVGPGGSPLATDQRGTGFPRKQGAHVDIGAFEQPPAGTMLTLSGTGGNDSIVVTQVGASLKINVNGKVTHRGAFEFAGIVLNGADGDDFLFLDKAITLPFTLNGGNGNDLMHPGAGPGNVIGGAGTDSADYSDNTAGVSVSADDVANDGPGHNQNVRSDVEMLLGGSGNDTLVGNALVPNLLAGNGGNDVLRGLGGRDVLIGGTGKDQLFGDADDDLLIDSRTVYDGNVLFLRTLRFEWQNPANDYQTRINRLKAGVLGVRITSANLPNDTAVDTLTGAAGRDWFVFHVGDVITDKAIDETATQL